MPEMRSVFSGWVSAIGYDAETSELHVTFRNGKTVVYEGVLEEKAAAVGAIGGTPPSIGEALHAHIIGKYPHR